MSGGTADFEVLEGLALVWECGGDVREGCEEEDGLEEAECCFGAGWRHGGKTSVEEALRKRA